MYILTDGKNYVMENPLKSGEYLQTTSPVQAKKFTFKQAKTMLNSRSKKMSYTEAKSLMGLAGWSMTQLKTYEEELYIGLSKFDSAESDLEHALQKYKEDNNGKKPQAHKMAKFGYLLDEIRDKHKHIKQCLDYVRVMEDAITYSYTIEKLKLELTKAKHTEYKGRTEYYQIALDLLE